MIWADRIADWTITWGGIAVILAVLGIMVFLVGEVLPLFRGGHFTASHEYRLDPPTSSLAALSLDEHNVLGLWLTRDGDLRQFHARTGAKLTGPRPEFGGRSITALAVTPGGSDVAYGLDDGTLRFGRLRYQSQIVPADQLPAGLTRLDQNDLTDGSAVYSEVPGGQYRKASLDLVLEDPVVVSPQGHALVALDYRVSGEAERQVRAFVAVDAAGQVRLSRAESRINLLSGKRRTVVQTSQLPELPEGADVAAVILSDKADQVLVAEADGRVDRYNTSDFDNPRLTERARVLPAGARLTAFGFLLGGTTIVVGGSDGALAGYFVLERKGAASADGLSLVQARAYPAIAGGVRHITFSRRDKSFAVSGGDGGVRVIHGTSQKVLLEKAPGSEGPTDLLGLQLSPRMDGLLVLDAQGRAGLYEFSVPHPETTWGTLFGKVWYEGYAEPGYTWQSTGGTDEFEPKLSLAPLIFGTLKATLYSLLFALPVAILAAIYTSEFMRPAWRAVIKPVMEMMASLPSVVLGFVAALVLAPFVENWIAAVILAFLGLPLAFVLAAYLWQLLPTPWAVRLDGGPKLAGIFLTAALGLALCYQAGPWFEDAFFGGDLKAWLNRDQGGPAPFLLLLLLPVSLLIFGLVEDRLLRNRLRDFLHRASRLQAAIWGPLRWLGLAAAALGLAWLLAQLAAWAGLDPRDGLVGTYVQRNTLVVGFAMGFAVIPIIYTIAEDALNSVPEHLRAASLGCGASPWQTAKWVVLPTALSGVFSAIMIGMGRAVGETMIVVMSAGNTPLMDFNIFNGLRALSATIAVELPEAVKDGTLYRVLFLAGLVLFSMTFIINTAAEVVRQRFRRRTHQL
ncbi:MAG: ABC transporter permease subunit [Pseudomonadota bacterium]